MSTLCGWAFSCERGAYSGMSNVSQNDWDLSLPFFRELLTHLFDLFASSHSHFLASSCRKHFFFKTYFHTFKGSYYEKAKVVHMPRPDL